MPLLLCDLDNTLVDRDAAFPPALAGHPGPAAGDVRIRHRQGQDLSRAQPGEQHQPGDRPVPVGAEADQQRRGLGPVQTPG